MPESDFSAVKTHCCIDALGEAIEDLERAQGRTDGLGAEVRRERGFEALAMPNADCARRDQ